MALSDRDAQVLAGLEESLGDIPARLVRDRARAGVLAALSVLVGLGLMVVAVAAGGLVWLGVLAFVFMFVGVAFTAPAAFGR